MAKKNMVGPFSIGTLLILLGALIGIIAIFLTWFDFSVDIFITTLSKTYTGMEFATEDLKTDDFQRLCPLIAWIVAILIAVLNVLPMVGVKIDSKIRNTASLIFGILVIILVVVWGTWELFSGYKMFDYAEAGAWMMIASGALAVIGSGLNFYMKR